MRARVRGGLAAWVLLLAWGCGDPVSPDAPVASVEVSPDTATRRTGTTIQLSATVRDTAGAELDGHPVTWTSSRPAIARVDEAGRVTAVAPGSAVITAAASGKTGTASVTVWQPETLVGAGDIAVCGSTGAPATAALLDGIPGTVFTAGDNAYPNGSDQDYADCYNPSWGLHRSRTRPTPGNHEYNTPDAAGYFNYFGAGAGARGKGYYSYDLGLWHVIALNSSLPVQAGSAQEQWLRADLAANSRLCVLAYWHHPRFSSGVEHGSQAFVQPLWDALYQAGAEVVLAGHEHVYERFAPQRPDGTADPAAGIRQFTVGTGGASTYTFGTPIANSEARGTSRGVLKLTLLDTGYEWEFVPVAGESFTDSGSGTCHQ